LSKLPKVWHSFVLIGWALNQIIHSTDDSYFCQLKCTSNTIKLTSVRIKRRPNRNDLDDLHSCRLTQTWVSGKHTKTRSVLLDLFNLNNHSTDVSYILRLPTKMYIKYKKIEANLLSRKYPRIWKAQHGNIMLQN